MPARHEAVGDSEGHDGSNLGEAIAMRPGQAGHRHRPRPAPAPDDINAGADTQELAVIRETFSQR